MGFVSLVASTLIAIAVANVVTALPAFGYSSVVVASNPVAYWPLAEATGSFADATGNGHTATESGSGPGISRAVPTGLFGGDSAGVKFNGLGENSGTNGGKYLRVPDSTAWDVNQVTLEGWTKCSSTLRPASFLIMQGGETGHGNYNWGLYEGGGADCWQFYVRETNYASGGEVAAATRCPRLMDGQWHHLVGTYDGQRVQLIIDGVVIDSVEHSAPMLQNAGDLRMGAWTFGTGYENHSDAHLAEVAVYNRALPLSEVREHYLASGLAGGPVADEEAWGWGDPDAQPHVALARGEAGDGIDTASGNVTKSFTDFSIPGRGPALELNRTYNSGRANLEGPFGYGWTSSLGASLAVNGPSAVLSQSSGARVAFAFDGSMWRAPPRTTATLVQNGDATWSYVAGKRTTYRFSSTRRLLSITDLNGYALAFAYDASNRLSTVTDASGRSLSFAYDAANRVSSVTDFTGRVVAYTINVAGDLTDVVDERGGHWQYAYDGATHRLSTVRTPRWYGDVSTPAKVTANHFDALGRVDWQSDELGRSTTLDYTTIAGATKVTDPKGYARVHWFTHGTLTKETRGYGTALAATWQYVYDRNNLGSSVVVDPQGHETSYIYDAAGNELTKTNALGHRWESTYDSLNNRITHTPPATYGGQKATTTYTYNGVNVTGESTPLLDTAGTTIATKLTSYFYDDPTEPGDVTRMVDPTGKTWSYVYDADGNRVSESDPLRNQTTHTFDRLGRRVSTVRPKGNVVGGTPDAYRSATLLDVGGLEQLSLDATGQPIVDTFTRGNATGLGSSETAKSWSNLLAGAFGVSSGAAYAVNAPAASVVNSYADGTFRVTVRAAQDETGFVFRGLDDRNHWRLVAKPASSTWNLVKYVNRKATIVGTTGAGTCCTAGQQLNVTANGSTIQVAVDGVLRLSVTDGALSTATKVGLYAASTGAARFDQLVAYRLGAGVTATGWDLNRNQVSVSDADGRTTLSVYDAADQLMRVDRADGTHVEYGYDLNGHRTSVEDAANQTAWTSYADPAHPSKPTAKIDRLNRMTSFEYDRAGNLYRTVDPSGRTTTRAYDNADRLDVIDYSDPNTPDVQDTTYDANGRRVSMTDGTGTTTWALDSLDRQTTSTNGAGQALVYGYDLAGRTTSIAYPGGACGPTPVKCVTRGYDDAGRLTTVTDWLGNTTSFTPDANGNIDLRTLPAASGVVDDYAYDADDRLQNVATTKGANTLASFAYARKASGRVLTVTPTGVAQPTETYGYSPLNELETVNSASYDYSPAGELVRLADGTVQAFDVANQLCWTAPAGSTGTCNTPPAGATLYGYDLQGNRVSKTPPTGPATAYTYDQANRLVLVSVGGVIVASYVYNGDGLRVSKTASGVTTSYAWDDTGELPLIVEAGNDSYIYAAGASPTEQVNGSTPTWLHTDHQGSVRVLTTSTGTVGGTYSYNAYGTTTSHTGTAATPMQYVGQYTDADTSLLYLRARYYDATTGQFLERDPFEGGSCNDYDYVCGDPVNNLDLDGKRCWTGENDNGSCNSIARGVMRSTKFRRRLGVQVNACVGYVVAGCVAAGVSFRDGFYASNGAGHGFGWSGPSIGPTFQSGPSARRGDCHSAGVGPGSGSICYGGHRVYNGLVGFGTGGYFHTRYSTKSWKPWD